MNSKKLRVAIIGCGRMGLHHVKAIGVVEGSELVAVADPQADVAAVQGVLPAGTKIYTDPTTMLREVKPDVVHVVTPPETHVDLARLALEHGVHVYVEKPFALSGDAARAIVDLAREKGLKVCAGHQVLFQHSGQHYQEYLPLLRKVVQVESYFSFKTVRRVGGGLMSPVEQLVDILPHPIYLMLDALEASAPDAVATPCELCALEVDADGEVRALLKRGDTPAMLTVTLRGRPIESYLRIVGMNGSLGVDFVLSGITRLLGPGASAISAVLNPFIRARQIAFGTLANIYRMLTRKHKSYAGLAELIEAFHRSVADGKSSPVSPYAIVETVRLCELIGQQLDVVADMAERNAAEQLARTEAKLPPPDRQRGTVLVTGGTGFLGRILVDELRSRGWPVRVVARRLPAAAARVPGVDYMLGNVGVSLSESVFDGVSVIAHLAAETYGGKEAHERNTIGATRILLEAAARHGIKRFLHTSSIAVLKPSGRFSGVLREDSAVDAGNLGRGPYVWGKAEAERMVTDFCKTHGIGQRQIRLGPLVDFANFTAPGRLGREVGPLYVAMGTPGNRLSVCDVKTASNVIRYYIEDFDTVPEMLNLVETPQPSRGELIKRLRAARPDLRVMWLPLTVVWMLSGALKLVLRLLKPGSKSLDLYSAFVSERYDSTLAAKVVEKAQGGSAIAQDATATKHDSRDSGGR
jgi:predicted dehydrogenase/nucleoside-diphosphate-sugar epimerase